MGSEKKQFIYIPLGVSPGLRRKGNLFLSRLTPWPEERDQQQSQQRHQYIEVKARKPEAFEHFFDLVEKRVFAFGLNVCGQVQDAKDTPQETLLRAFKALPNLEFKDSKALNVWLYKVAKNSCLMMRRKSKYQPEHELSLDEFMPGNGKEGAPKEIPDWSNLPDDALLKEELRELVRRATLALPAQYRLALVMRDMEQLSTREVAEALDISEQNVKIRLHRARLLLRQELGRYFKEGDGATHH